jgi:hypothetical protein
MSSRIHLIATLVCVFLLTAASNHVLAGPSDDDAVYQKAKVHRSMVPTDISYRVMMRLNSQPHKNRWTKNQVAITLHGTTGSFRMMFLPTSMGISAPQWNFEDNRLKKDASAETQAECKKVDYEGCALEWIFPGTHQNVSNIGPIAAISLDCHSCGNTDDFQYGFLRVEYRQKGSDPVVSRFSKEGWLKDWGAVVRNVTYAEDELDPNAVWQSVDCVGGMGCKVGEFYKVMDLRSSSKDSEKTVTTRHEMSLDEYSRFITETKNSWEVSAEIKTKVLGQVQEFRGKNEGSTEKTSENSKQSETKATHETIETRTVPAGYLVIYHETVMAKGSYQPSGKFNLGTRLNPNLNTTNEQWLFFTNDNYGVLRQVEWRENPDTNKREYKIIPEPIKDEYLALLKERGFID